LIDDPQQAIDQIATHLAKAREPNLVVMVHGFNNPRPAVLGAYAVRQMRFRKTRRSSAGMGSSASLSLAVGKNGKHRAWLARLAAGAVGILITTLTIVAVAAALYYWQPNVKLYLPYIPDFVPGLWNRSGCARME